MATLWKCVAEPSGNPPGPSHAARSAAHYACRRRLTPLAGDKIDAPAACAVPFRPYCEGVITRTRNVSEYMLVLALYLVVFCDNSCGSSVAAIHELNLVQCIISHRFYMRQITCMQFSASSLQIQRAQPLGVEGRGPKKLNGPPQLFT